MSRSRLVSTCLTVVALLSAVTACGSDESSKDTAAPTTTAASTTTAAGSSTEAPTTDADTAPVTAGPTTDADTVPATDAPTTDAAAVPATEPAEPTGEPIRLGLITRPLYMPFLPAGAEAAIERINDSGGVNGRPLELVTCSNEDNATAAAACAQKFADDPTIVATVGDNNSFGADTNPILENVKVAGVGTSPLGAGDYASPRIFASNSGGLEFLATAAFLYDALGSKNIGMAIIDSPTAQALPGLMDSQVLASRGAKLGGTVNIPVASADVSSQAAALSGLDGQAIALTQDLALRYIQASRQQGYAGPFMLSETVVAASALKEALSPDELKDVYAVTYFDKNSEGYKNFLSDMEMYRSDIVPGDLNAIAWLSVNMFAHVAEGLDEVTREGIWDAMNALSDYDTDGMTQPLDFTTAGTALGGKAPRLVPSVLAVYADVYKDGEYVPVSDDQVPIPVFS